MPSGSPKSFTMLEPLWQGSCRGFSSGSCRSCAKRLFWKGFRMGSRSRAGAIFCLRRRSLKNELRAAPCCGFTSSSSKLPNIFQKKPFCQMFSRTASTPPEKLLLQRRQSRSHFQRNQRPAKQALISLERRNKCLKRTYHLILTPSD